RLPLRGAPPGFKEFRCKRETLPGALGAALKCTRAEPKSMLLRQADLLPQRLHARIAPKKRHLRITIEELSYSDWPQGSHTIESFQCAFFVAETGEDQRLLVRILGSAGHLLSLLAAAGQRIGVPEKAPLLRILSKMALVIDQDLDRLAGPPLP